MADIKDLDLYGLLELNIDSTEQEIRTAYRKKALKCHPDKNPDDKKAAETFHLLSKAIEVLLDKSAREAYDRVIRRKEDVKIRNSKLDSTRKKFKEDLEKREKEAETQRLKGYKVKKSEEEILQQEIDRLRKEGSIRLQEEIKLMTEELKAAADLNEANVKENPENYRLRIKWKSKPEETKINEEYTQDVLNKIFSKYGSITVLVVSAKKPGSALLEFQHTDSARRAKLYEVGFPGNPFKLSYLNPDTERSEARNQTSCSDFINQFNTRNDRPVKSDSGSTDSSSDFNKTNTFPCFSTASNNSDVTSASIFPSFVQSSNTLTNTNKSSSLFPSASESTTTKNSTTKSTNTMFPMPSGLFPSSNMSSNLFPTSNKPGHLILRSKKNSKDLDYEEAVLSQMRKAQEKNS